MRVRIEGAASDLLRDLSTKTGRPKGEVIEHALCCLREQLFWASVREAFDKGESEELRAERELWDGATGDGLKVASW